MQGQRLGLARIETCISSRDGGRCAAAGADGSCAASCRSRPLRRQRRLVQHLPWRLHAGVSLARLQRNHVFHEERWHRRLTSSAQDGVGTVPECPNCRAPGVEMAIFPYTSTTTIGGAMAPVTHLQEQPQPLRQQQAAAPVGSRRGPGPVGSARAPATQDRGTAIARPRPDD